MAEETGVDVESNGNELHLMFIFAMNLALSSEIFSSVSLKYVINQCSCYLRNKTLGGILINHSNFPIITFLINSRIAILSISL